MCLKVALGESEGLWILWSADTWFLQVGTKHSHGRIGQHHDLSLALAEVAVDQVVGLISSRVASRGYVMVGLADEVDEHRITEQGDHIARVRCSKFEFVKSMLNFLPVGEPLGFEQGGELLLLGFPIHPKLTVSWE